MRPTRRPACIPTTIDTGVVILTGEALRRENAQAIAGVIAGARRRVRLRERRPPHGGDARRLRLRRRARCPTTQAERLLNIDIGGGTTKLALVDSGKVVATAAIHIGGRLLVVDDEGRIIRLDPAGRHHAERAGFRWQIGDRVAPAELDRVAERMADALVAALTRNAAAAAMWRGSISPTRSPIWAASRAWSSPAASPSMSMTARSAISAISAGASAAPSGGASTPGALPWPLLPARRMHPRHRARRVRVQRTAQRQHQLHLRSRRPAAAAQSPGAAAAVHIRREGRRGSARAGDPRPIAPPSTLTDGERRDRACLPLAGRAVLRAHRRLRRRVSRRASRTASQRVDRSS